jgi:uncharacterized repeat protein (TIGR01451 family)
MLISLESSNSDGAPFRQWNEAQNGLCSIPTASILSSQGARFPVVRLVTIIVALVAALAAFPTVAQEPSVAVRLIAEVRMESGASSGNPARYFVPATVLEQGREVFYTVSIRNPGAESAQNVVVVQRVPQNTSYVPRSAAGPGAEITLSTDGGQTFAAEDALIYTDPTGLTRPATAQDCTHIRWRLRNPLAPGAVALARFRATFR